MPQTVRHFVKNICSLGHEKLSLKKDWIFLLLIYGSYVVSTIVLAMHHEPWRDEAQDWLMARDLDIFSIFKMLSYSGHPILWHATLKVLHILHLPYSSMFVLNLIIAWAAMYVFLVWSPFSKIVKVLITFSTPLLVEYSTVARSYALCLLLLFTVTALYEKRAKYPIMYSLLVCLIFNIHYLCLTAAVSLLVLFIIDMHKKVRRGKYYILISIMIFGMIFALLTLIPTADEGEARRIEPFVFNSITEPATNSLSLDLLWNVFPVLDTEKIRFIVGAISSLILIIPLLSFLQRKRTMFFLYGSYIILFGIFIFKLRGELRHHFFLITFLIIAFWMSSDISELPVKTKGIWKSIRSLGILVIMCSLSLSVCNACRLAIKEYKHPFSSAKYMASFINKNKLNETHIIVSNPSWSGSALLPYLPDTKFWYPDKNDFGTFIIWNQERERLDREFKFIDRLMAAVNQHFRGRRNVLVLLNKPVNHPDRYNMKIIKEYADSDAIKLCERYYLYYLSPDKRDSNSGLK